MECGVGVGVGAGDVFVEVCAEACAGRRDDITVLPFDGRGEQFSVETTEGLDRFKDQEVGCAGGEGDVGEGFDRAAVQVRGDLDVMGFGYGCDLLGFEDASGSPQGGLEDGRGLGFDHPGEFVFGGEAFAGGDRYRGLAGDSGHLFDVVGWHWFFEPHRVEGFEGLGEADGSGCCELTVGAEEQVGSGAHGFADGRDEGAAAFDCFEARHVSVVDGVGAGGVELDRGEASFHFF